MINIFGVVLFLRTGWLVVSADLAECVNEHFPPHLLTLYLHHHPNALDSVLFTVGIAYVLSCFVAFQKVPLKCKAEVVFVSGFLL